MTSDVFIGGSSRHGPPANASSGLDAGLSILFRATSNKVAYRAKKTVTEGAIVAP